ncbi:hypothetical protein [Nocardia sp. CS682]|uniref:hypothetical protein n=1 Tax=Nocardia sp. CS682 TaxID=1047172 RepID=UPI001F0F514D|nr:hypothetical protein [Nocardia sp. CS682]
MRNPLASAARIVRFTAVMYKPHYLLYGVLWVLALEGTASLVTQPDSAWRPTGATLVRVVVVAFVLLYLRMVDEQKDLEYDRVHNPDRPLVTGAVSAVELRVAMGLIALGAIAGSLALSVGSAAMIAVAMAYGLVLWGLEWLFATVRTNIMVNLFVTYPVQLLVTGYVVVSAIDTGEVRAQWQAAAVAGVFAGAFLQFEFARKTSRERRPDELLYSNALGAKGSTAASLLCAVAAALCDIALVRPWDHSLLAWLPVPLLLIPAFGALKFLRGDRVDYPAMPAVVFILALYLTLIGQALSLS